jgi:hypothetical protein
MHADPLQVWAEINLIAIDSKANAECNNQHAECNNQHGKWIRILISLIKVQEWLKTEAIHAIKADVNQSYPIGKLKIHAHVAIPEEIQAQDHLEVVNLTMCRDCISQSRPFFGRQYERSQTYLSRPRQPPGSVFSSK